MFDYEKRMLASRSCARASPIDLAPALAQRVVTTPSTPVYPVANPPGLVRVAIDLLPVGLIAVQHPFFSVQKSGSYVML